MEEQIIDSFCRSILQIFFNLHFSTLSLTIDGPATRSISRPTVRQWHPFLHTWWFFQVRYWDFFLLQPTIFQHDPPISRWIVNPSVAPHLVRISRFDFNYLHPQSTIITYRPLVGQQTVSGSVAHHFCTNFSTIFSISVMDSFRLSLNDHTFTLRSFKCLEKIFLIWSEIKLMLIGK